MSYPEPESFEEGSSHEAIIEFGQNDYDLKGAEIIDNILTANLGVAEIYHKKYDKIIVYDPENQQKLRIIKEIYRGIVVKSSKREKYKTLITKNDGSLQAQPANQDQLPEEIQEKQSEELFDSTPEEEQIPSNKAKIKKVKKSIGDVLVSGKGRLKRKLKNLSKKMK